MEKICIANLVEFLSTRAYYTRKKFRTTYENTMLRSPRLHRNNSSIFQASKSLLQKNPNTSPKSYISQDDFSFKFEFDYPFSELLVSINKHYDVLIISYSVWDGSLITWSWLTGAFVEYVYKELHLMIWNKHL